MLWSGKCGQLKLRELLDSSFDLVGEEGPKRKVKKSRFHLWMSL
jgi:hypothetical protein